MVGLRMATPQVAARPRLLATSAGHEGCGALILNHGRHGLLPLSQPAHDGL